jgi:hypothetical protein
MKGYFVSDDDMKMLNSLRLWISSMVKNASIEKSEYLNAANFCIDISEVLSASKRIKITQKNEKQGEGHTPAK